MPLDMLPWMGLASQMAGALILFFSGGLGLGTRAYSFRGTALGLAFFGAGCVSLALFAFFERHFLLTGVQFLAAILVSAGVARKSKGRRNRP
jgi:hypothetical protein